MPINDVVRPKLQEITRPLLDQIAADQADTIPLEEIEAAAIIQKERIGLIVAGVSYPRPSQGNQLDPKKHRTYFKLALNYKNYLLANNVVDRVTVLDFLPGRWVSFSKGGPKDGERLRPLRDPIVPKNYRFNDNEILTHQAPGKGARKLYYTGIDQFAKEKTGSEDADVEKSEYDPWTGAKENSMSIQDVYERIRYGFAGTIREVHFIGHAWLGGPIIVNTPPYRTKKYDKDGRVQDFSHPGLTDVFGPQGLPIFRANLAADAVLCVWGCENNECARNLYLQAEAGARLKLKANDPCQQTLDDWFGREAERLKVMMASTYAANLAKATQRPVYGALPGTYSVHEGEPNDDATKIGFDPVVMHVNLEKCRHILEFYRKKLAVTFAKTGAFKGDPTFGRGFAIYQPS